MIADIGENIRNHSLFKCDSGSTLFQIEKDVDGLIFKPYVRLYSKKEAVNLFVKGGFVIQEIRIRQINFKKLLKL